MTDNASVPAAPENKITADIAAAPRLESVKVVDGRLTLAGSEAEHALVDQAFGSGSTDFQSYCLKQLVMILPEQKQEDFTLDVNAALVMLSAISPRDALEGMLAVQMVASHHMSLLAMRRTKNASMLPQYEANGNLANKFARTFAAQVEALNRHRRGGKQIVEHVHINAGGQAVIAGTVNTGGRG